MGIGGGGQEVGQTLVPFWKQLQRGRRQVGGGDTGRHFQRPQGDQGAAVVVGQGGAESGLQGVFGALAGLFEIPVRGRDGGGGGGGVLERPLNGR